MIGSILPDFDTLTNALEFIALSLTIGATMWGMTKVPIKRWQVWLNRHKAEESQERRMIDKEIPKLMESMDKVLAELKPNHQTSMRDAVDRIEAMVIKSDRTTEAWLNLDSRPMYMTDDKGHMIWCNRAYVSLHERPKEDLLGLGFMSTIAKHDLDRVFKVIEDFEKKNIFTSILDYDIQLPDGTFIPVHANNHAMHDTNGKQTGVVGYLEVRDV